jgi:hypothetical protein
MSCNLISAVMQAGYMEAKRYSKRTCNGNPTCRLRLVEYDRLIER